MVESDATEGLDLERVCQGVSPSDEPCDYPATVHCPLCKRWFCEAHAEDGPVVEQAFPDAARAFRDIGLRAAQVMHLHVFVGAVAEELRAPGAEVGQPAMYCSEVKVVVRRRWIVDMRAHYNVNLKSALMTGVCLAPEATAASAGGGSFHERESTLGVSFRQ
jgi:hypothetical protein